MFNMDWDQWFKLASFEDSCFRLDQLRKPARSEPSVWNQGLVSCNKHNFKQLNKRTEGEY